jgi:hypothetical protein
MVTLHFGSCQRTLAFLIIPLAQRLLRFLQMQVHDKRQPYGPQQLGDLPDELARS